MGDIVKLALRLFIFALVASVLLAVTNEVTKGPIEQQKLASKMAALNTVLPGCEYEQIEYEGISDDSALDEIFIGKNADGSIKGYALTANPQGYGGEIPITLGVSEGGYVTQVYVGSLQETQGLGSRVATTLSRSSSSRLPLTRTRCAMMWTPLRARRSLPARL